MPTYEYQCKKCGKRFEAFQSIIEPALSKCKFCDGRVQRLISPGAGFIFKGSGFYATDYRKPGPKKEKPKNSPGPCTSKGEGCSHCPHAQ